jgi:Uma2 family endonuclease
VIILPSKVGFLEINTAILNLMLWDWHFRSGDTGWISERPAPVRFRGGTFAPDLTWTKSGQAGDPLVPDFAVILRKPEDSLRDLHKPMVSLIESGTRLGWLIDPYNQKVCLYRANGTGELIEDFLFWLSGEDVLPGLEIPLPLLMHSYASLIIPYLEAQSN